MPNSVLYTEVCRNNVEGVRELLRTNGNETIEERGSLYFGSDDRQTPLQLAVRCGYEEIVKLLVRYNANVNIRNSDGGTLLHIAARNYFQGIVLVLTQAGVDVNVTDIWGDNALHECIKDHRGNIHGRLGIASILIENGVDFNAVNLGGETCLHLAVDADDVDMCELLIAHGVDTEPVDSDGRTAEGVAYALENIYTEDFKYDPSEENNVLIHAHREMVELLRLERERVEKHVEKERLHAIAMAFAGNHVNDPNQHRLLPEDTELMRLVMEYLHFQE